jgi:hypothetical protein
MAPSAPVKPRPQQAQAPVPSLSFLCGTQSVDEGGDYDSGAVALTASTQDLTPPWVIQPTGWLRGIYLDCQLTTAGNSAAVTFSQNGPFNSIDTLQFLDTNNKPVIGPFDAYTMMVAVKLGGYAFSEDPRASVLFSAVTGTGATGGSARFVLYIPIEIVKRDALGLRPSVSNTAAYTVKIRVAASATVYGVAPTAAPTIRVRGYQDFFWQVSASASANYKGAEVSRKPPAGGTTQYWVLGNYPVQAGAVPNLQLTTAALGGAVRNIVLILVDSNNSRLQGEADWPDPVTIQLDTAQLVASRTKSMWQYRIGRAYGYNASTFDTANAKENGVYHLWYNEDFGLKPGAETRRSYLITKPGEKVAFQGTVGGTGTHTLFALVNYVSPPGNDFMSLLRTK